MIQLVWTPPATFRVTFCSLAARAPGSNYGKTVIIELGRVRGSGLPEAGGDAAGGRGVISRDAGRHRDCTEGRLIFLHYCAPPIPSITSWRPLPTLPSFCVWAGVTYRRGLKTASLTWCLKRGLDSAAARRRVTNAVSRQNRERQNRVTVI